MVNFTRETTSKAYATLRPFQKDRQKPEIWGEFLGGEYLRAVGVCALLQCDDVKVR